MAPERPTPFTRRMYELCEIMPKRVPGYFPGDFHRALVTAGDDFAPRAKEFLRGGLQTGLERLARARALDTSMEWAIVYDNWPEFSAADREAAHQRLVIVAALYGLPSSPPIPSGA